MELAGKLQEFSLAAWKEENFCAANEQKAGPAK